MAPNKVTDGTPPSEALRTAKEGQHLGLLISSEVRFLREALSEVLRRESAVAVLALCADLEEAIARGLSQQPDIVLLDASFRDGVTAARRLRAAVPQACVVVLAVAETTENIIAWAEAGVTGYVPQTTALVDLVDILISISHGNQVCSAQITSRLLRHVARTAQHDHGEAPYQEPTATLTKREREISVLIGAGLR